MSQRHIIAFAGVGALLLGACSLADIAGTGVAPGDVEGGASTAGEGGTPACVDSDSVAQKPEDPNKYPKCACATKGGAARCVPKANIPASVAGKLEACNQGGAGLCVPDTIVKSGGKAPPTCNSPFGEGRCLSLCVPDVASQADVLDRGEGNLCAEDERCAPCFDPLKNNAATGVCDIGNDVAAPKCVDAGATVAPQSTPAKPPAAIACPYTGPALIDVTKFPTCGDGARCVAPSLVPAATAAMLKTCPTGICAPEKSIAAGGQYLPKTCTAVVGAEGRCLNVNIPAVDTQKAQLTRDVCDANELCSPCFNPVDGKATGACATVSCDASKQAAKTFTACCTKQGMSRAKCVPKTIIPVAEQGNLDDDNVCQKNVELCVPNEMLQPNFKGPACTASTLLTGKYTGVCLSDCLSFGFIDSLGISKGSCADGFQCAPCENGGKPTGAPGCPGT